ncbi:hypothetical protein EVAR_9537_1 [Eumeta japonica]|uniref:Arginine/serine-rich protein PNISR n=1 Tax=Eumeta variegata TaxID=151549 RepID=A0A4C1U550_EUMVA|nr:hypothetical protein EVAR_9537_1 [Eumeta japonica]
MFPGKDSANYPTQWALNPTAYQNIDSSQVDWAALAQQWIAMKEAASITVVPPAPPPKIDDEEGEAPMEVENLEVPAPAPPVITTAPPVAPPPATQPPWNNAPSSWNNSWNQWGWNWPPAAPPPIDTKTAVDPNLAIPPVVDDFSVPPDSATPIPGYTTGPVAPPTFQHGYWTAQQGDSNTDANSKPKIRDMKPSSIIRNQRLRDKPIIPPVIEPVVMPASMSTSTIDAAKRRQLPAWIREGLEKMEREKLKALEREQEKIAREEAEKEKKRLEEEELARMKAEASGEPVIPAKSKFDSDSEEETDKEKKIKEEDEEEKPPDEDDRITNNKSPSPILVKKNKEEIMQEVCVGAFCTLLFVEVRGAADKSAA